MHEPVDAQYRRMIAQDLDVSMLVEAGAGSGKTTSLVDRMLSLIASNRCTVEKMAAVTFTRKAAAELKGRFQIELEKAVREARNDERRGRFQEALDHLGRLFVGTIHSFCARILRERPIEARLDPDFKELEENENTILRDRCWSEYLEGLHITGSPVLNTLRELGINPGDLLPVYQNVAQYPEVEVAREKLQKPDFSNEKERLRSFL